MWKHYKTNSNLRPATFVYQSLVTAAFRLTRDLTQCIG